MKRIYKYNGRWRGNATKEFANPEEIFHIATMLGDEVHKLLAYSQIIVYMLYKMVFKPTTLFEKC